MADSHFKYIAPALVDYLPSCKNADLAPLMVIGDHASNNVADTIELGVAPDVLQTHRAVDLGTSSLAKALHMHSGCAIANACVSRLIVDLNRFRDESSTIPQESDGIKIAGNILNEKQREARLSQYYDGYHEHIAALVAQEMPRLIIFLHSFTPALNSDGQKRPWHYGVMYDQDDRAGRLALRYLNNLGICVGDQLPYSGKIYNSSFGRHAESHNIAYLGLEVRQDLLSNSDGIDNAMTIISGMAKGILQHL